MVDLFPSRAAADLAAPHPLWEDAGSVRKEEPVKTTTAVGILGVVVIGALVALAIHFGAEPATQAEKDRMLLEAAGVAPEPIIPPEARALPAECAAYVRAMKECLAANGNSEGEAARALDKTASKWRESAASQSASAALGRGCARALDEAPKGEMAQTCPGVVWRAP